MSGRSPLTQPSMSSKISIDPLRVGKAASARSDSLGARAICIPPYDAHCRIVSGADPFPALPVPAPDFTEKWGAVTANDRRGAAMVAAAFTRPVFRALAQAGPLPPAAARSVASLANASKTHSADVEPTLGQAFDRGFTTLQQQYRCEYYFKAQLVSKVVFGRHSPRTANALLELPMGPAIADVMIVNGTTTVYEIKTDLDNFDRLGGQLQQYSTRAEYTNVLVSERRAERAIATLPTWVGVLALRQNGALATVRPGRSRLDHLLPDDQFQLLRTEEARTAVAATTGRVVDAPPARAWGILRAEFSNLSPAVANAAVVRELRSRGAAVANLTAARTFPRSLRALAYAQPLSGAAQARLVNTLATPVSAFC